jgi:RNA polymerase sigma-70 factor (ECF subfamily)
MLKRRIDRRLDIRIDPEDDFQDVCLVAQRRWPEFLQLRQQPDASAYVWLYGLVRDQLIDHWRQATRGRRDIRCEVAWPEVSAEQLGLHLIDSGTSPNSKAAREELRKCVGQVLELLPDGDYEIVKMRHFDHLKYKEVAELLNITTNAATQRYVRALEKLKAIWQILFSEVSDAP